MARRYQQIVMLNGSPVRVLNNDLTITAIIASKTNRSGSCVLTKREIADLFGCTPKHVADIVRHAVDTGFITSTQAFRTDGSQRGNRYKVTPYGRDLLRTCDRTQLNLASIR